MLPGHPPCYSPYEQALTVGGKGENCPVRTGKNPFVLHQGNEANALEAEGIRLTFITLQNQIQEGQRLSKPVQSDQGGCFPEPCYNR